MLYIASGTASIIHMYNITDNFAFLGVFFDFDGAYFLEAMAIHLESGRVFFATDDYPYLLIVKMNNSAPGLSSTPNTFR